ncbi:MAG TPA: TIGR03118 family protein [Anaeromyxobacteraceae bacterium]|nr:TIGR03118 family protein [Anaeromyxobacteraceae bacterium]
MRIAVWAACAAAVVFPACGSKKPSYEASAVTAPSGASGAHEAEGQYLRRDLVSDGFLPAEQPPDADLVNAWGLAALPTSPWWIADNGTALSTLYDGDGEKQALRVAIPGAGGAPAAPTGLVANTTTDFVIMMGPTTAPARFMFASEDGTLSAWTLTTPPSTTAVGVIDNSASGAVYKGLSLASTAAGSRLYATNFHEGVVEVFDGAFAPVPSPGAFMDPAIPAGFAPFGILAAGGVVYVTYAKQDADRHDDVQGPHLGFVDAYATDGTLLHRVASRGKLDAPWGLAVAPADFGPHSGRLLVGNFGDGHIVSYALHGDRGDGRRDRIDMAERGRDDDDDGGGAGRYLTARGGRVTIDGLWALAFGNGARAGPTNALFFTAGPGDEAHGLFGRIDFVPGD